MLPGKPSIVVWSLAVICLVSPAAVAQSKRSDSRVKIEPSAGPIDASGRQTVAVKLTVDPGWHLTANPSGNEDYKGSEVRLAVASAKGLQSVQVSYPAGKEMKDPDGKPFRAYEGEVVLRATVLRASGDTGPLELTLFLQVCDEDSRCMAPATVKRTVP